RDAEGRVRGQFVATGAQPGFFARLAPHGFADLDEAFFAPGPAADTDPDLARDRARGELAQAAAQRKPPAAMDTAPAQKPVVPDTAPEQKPVVPDTAPEQKPVAPDTTPEQKPVPQRTRPQEESRPPPQPAPHRAPVSPLRPPDLAPPGEPSIQLDPEL